MSNVAKKLRNCECVPCEPVVAGVTLWAFLDVKVNSCCEVFSGSEPTRNRSGICGIAIFKDELEWKETRRLFSQCSFDLIFRIGHAHWKCKINYPVLLCLSAVNSNSSLGLHL